ncbi:hypothetical protein AAGR22_18835 [Erwinia sp. HDF1-3R]|uniref:hypothetical protein n=1 Tax=Erwinia sp. HDF1-3R TaxID=3141543 RepID=UPI0031F581DD
MIPSYYEFTRRHLLFFLIGCFITTLILTTSLARNAPDAGLTDMFFGLSAIGGSFAWMMASEGRAYWIYTLCSQRMHEDIEALKSLFDQPEIKIEYYLTKPWCSLLATLAAVAAMCLIGILLSPAVINDWLAFCGITVLPFWLYLCHSYALRNNIRQSLYHLSRLKPYPITKHGIRRYLFEDTVVMLVVNLALVLPIARKPAFALNNGSQTPAFIIAMIILMEIVLVLMLMLGKKSKRYLFCGELMLEELEAPTCKSPYITKGNRFSRAVFWCLLVCIWTIFVCLISSFAAVFSFTLIYLCALTLPLGIFLLERFHTLELDYHQAVSIISEYRKIAPDTQDNWDNPSLVKLK